MAGQMVGRRAWNAAGLATALLGIPVITLVFRLFVAGDATPGQLVAREIAIFLALGLLLWIVRRGEKLTLASIGVRRGGNGRSLLWGLLAFVLLGLATVAALGLVQVLGLPYGRGHAGVPPLWVTLLVVLRAGIVEEVSYRGYAMERIEALTGSRGLAVLVPLTAFAAFHFRQGMAGILIALLLGAVLAGVYLWRRDLKANIVGHVLIDVVPNVLLPLLAG